MAHIGKMVFESIVRPEHRGFLLVDSLCARFTYHSREEWEDRIQSGAVLVNGVIATLETRVETGNQVLYQIDNYAEPDVPTHFDVLFEDDEFLLVDKPAGVPVHHTGHIFYNTFTSILRRAFDNEEITPMHRLDRDTGGIMLFSKNRDTATRFQRHLDLILLKKIYLAVVHGRFPQEIQRCDLALQEKKDSRIRLKMYPCLEGKPSTTLFRLVKHREALFHSIPGPFSFVEAELVTGRKHQIRAHLSALGYPVVADRLYGHEGFYYEKMLNESLTTEDYAVLGAENQMLHAYKVQLKLPYFKEPQWFESKAFTKEMQEMLTDQPSF